MPACMSWSSTAEGPGSRRPSLPLAPAGKAGLTASSRVLDFRSPDATFPATFRISRGTAMAKAASIKIKLVSSADTGYYYVAKKNSRTMTDKLVKKKYDPVAKKHVEFRETKIK